MCGSIDDCGPNACGNGNCVDKVNGHTCNCDAGHELMLQGNDSGCVAKECGTLSLEHGSVEPAKMLFGDVGVVTCLPGFTLSGGVKCGADADFVPVGSVCSPRSRGVPPREHRVLQKRCPSKAMSHTYDRGYNIGGLATLTREFTRTCQFDGSFSQTDVVCLPRPCGVLPLAHSASPFRCFCGVWAKCDVHL